MEPRIQYAKEPMFNGGTMQRAIQDDARKSVLIGSVAEVKQQVERFAEAGVTDFGLAQFPRPHRESLLRFSEEIIPEFS